MTSERHLSRTDDCTLTRPTVRTAALHADRIPCQVLALPGPQRHPIPGDEDLRPETIPLGFIEAATRQRVGGRDPRYRLSQGQGHRRAQSSREALVIQSGSLDAAASKTGHEKSTPSTETYPMDQDECSRETLTLWRGSFQPWTTHIRCSGCDSVRKGTVSGPGGFQGAQGASPGLLAGTTTSCSAALNHHQTPAGLPDAIVVFRSRLHSLPRNSGVVQTSMDTEMSQVPCTELHSAQ